jgi:hypothetical protein
MALYLKNEILYSTKIKRAFQSWEKMEEIEYILLSERTQSIKTT